ncbi:MAG: TlpA family protein disulfide reductase [Solirubrobacterales bacterium]|nr:TlpA family protein disulfide reductase [Solirubrobacterales bacterium]
MNSASHRRLLVLMLLGAALAAVIATGCGPGDEEAVPAPDYAKKLAGSPPPLADLHAESDELLSGGVDAFNGQLAELKGFPVGVNVWASWCVPCRNEFPLFQSASARMGRNVAFLGVNSNDDEDAAATFLSTHSVPYPSFSDPDQSIAKAVGASHGIPATAFYNADGEQTIVKHGEFRDQAELDQYIRQYATGSGSS